MARNRYRLVQHRGHHRLGRRRVNRPLLAFATLSLRCLCPFATFLLDPDNLRPPTVAIFPEERKKEGRTKPRKRDGSCVLLLRAAMQSFHSSLRSRFRPRAHFSLVSHSLFLLYSQFLTPRPGSTRGSRQGESSDSLIASGVRVTESHGRKGHCVVRQGTHCEKAQSSFARKSCLGWEEHCWPSPSLAAPAFAMDAWTDYLLSLQRVRSSSWQLRRRKKSSTLVRHHWRKSS